MLKYYASFAEIKRLKEINKGKKIQNFPQTITSIVKNIFDDTQVKIHTHKFKNIA